MLTLPLTRGAPETGRNRLNRSVTASVRKARLCEVPDYVKMLPARQLFQALDRIVASHSFRTLQFLKLAHEQA
jgi:hypothetical protein